MKLMVWSLVGSSTFSHMRFTVEPGSGKTSQPIRSAKMVALVP